MAQSVEIGGLAAELPPPVRLAVAYAPAAARAAWIALLVFDHRLSRVVAGAGEPLIGQLKLAWWRDRMREPASRWPAGEPLLGALKPLATERASLEALVDGWEGLIDVDAGDEGPVRLAAARAGAVAALARILDCKIDSSAIAILTRRWTLPGKGSSRPTRLPRAMRPLVILANLPGPNDAGPLALLRIVRLGILGR